MNRSLIVDCYRKLNKSELKSFGLFLKSPYFNTNKEIIRLHDCLRKYYPSFENSKLSKAEVFKSIFREKPFKENVVNQLLSKMAVLFEDFVAVEELTDKDFLKKQLSIHRLLEKGYEKLPKRMINRLGKSYIEADGFDIDVYYGHYLFNKSIMKYEELFGDRINSDIYLKKSSQNLDIFYLSEKMIFGALLANKEKIFKKEIDLAFYDTISSVSADYNQQVGSDFLNINQQLYNLLRIEDKSHFDFIKQSLSENETSSPHQMLYISFIRNFCIREINKGNVEFLDELFELNQLMVDKALIVNNGRISEWLYKNFIAVGLRLKKYEWTESFIQTYSENLSQKNYKNAYNYNLSNLKYTQKKYNDALDLLLNVEFSDVIYMLDGKALLLKIYYETGEYEAAESLSHSFKLLLLRQKKISVKKKSGFQHLIRIINLLIRFQQRKSTFTKSEYQKDVEKIKQKIEKFDVLANKSWVLARVDEIEK